MTYANWYAIFLYLVGSPIALKYEERDGLV